MMKVIIFKKFFNRFLRRLRRFKNTVKVSRANSRTDQTSKASAISAGIQLKNGVFQLSLSRLRKGS